MSPRWSRFLCLLLLAGPVAVPARAALGETLAEIQKRFGRPDPQLQQAAQKNVVVWSIETDQAERLVYSVTFNAKGLSIAEGLKPVRRAMLTEALAQNFVDNQLAQRRNPAGTRNPKPGEKYRFGGEEFTCLADEAVWVDEPNDLLIVWLKGPKGQVLAVRAEMLQAAP